MNRKIGRTEGFRLSTSDLLPFLCSLTEWRLCALLVCAKLAIDSWLLHAGFSHISDDDYARTVIAEQFAHIPRLDPSGTSWLPSPFWVEGAAMLVAGRSLAVARAIAVALGAISVVAPYLAMRVAGMKRGAAVIATGIAMALPWNTWLGVATVPEGWTGAIVAGAMMAMVSESTRAWGWGAAALLVGSLARYEAWPVCAVFAAFCLLHPTRRATNLVAALVAIAGPVAWMAWNGYAHGSALHFVTRVATFRQTIGAADISLSEKLAQYPKALLLQLPEATLLGALGLGVTVTRARWRWPAAAAAAMMAFLVWGDVRDGAPTHHAVRALVPMAWVLIAMGVDAMITSLDHIDSPRRRASWVLAGGIATLVWCVTLPERWSAFPGASNSERRDTQIARGLDMRARGIEHAEIVPCSFEHFALLAAWGQPERATIAKRTGEEPTSACPRIVER